MNAQTLCVLAILGLHVYHLTLNAALHGRPQRPYHGGWAFGGVIIALLLYWGAGLFEVFA